MTSETLEPPSALPGADAHDHGAAGRVAWLVGRVSGVIGAALAGAMLLMICYDVLMRYAFNAPTDWANEMSGYALAGIVFLGLAYAQVEGAHVRVDLVVSRLSPGLRHLLERATAWIGLWFVVIFLWQAVVLAVSSYGYGTRSYGLLNTPVWMPQTIMSLGVGLLVLVLVAQIAASETRLSHVQVLAGLAVALLLAAALFWIGPRPLTLGRSVMDWGSVVIAAGWLVAMLIWAGWRVALIAVAAVALVAVAMLVGQGLGLGGMMAGFGLAILAMLALGMPVAVALGLVGLIGIYAVVPIPSLVTLSERAWSNMESFTLTAIPMFVLMGIALLRSGISDDLFEAVSKWFGRVPGGIAHAGIGACAIFSAVSGSSLATASTIGMVACPEMERRGYDPRMNYGAIAAGGTLGILIPPSIAMIIYGSIVGVPVTRLFMAGIIPGLLLTAGFMGLVLIWALARPGSAPRATDSVPMVEKLRALWSIFPVILLISAVLGTLYAGIATPTEAAAVGALGAFFLCGWRGRLTAPVIFQSLGETAKVTAFLLFIVIGASVLSYIFEFVQLASELVRAVQAAGMLPWVTMVLIGLVYIALGMFMDPISMMVMTLPVVHPLITAMGFDPIWFGIVLVILIEIGLMTPPVGMNLFVLQGVNPGAKTTDIMAGALPFIGVMLLMLGLLAAFPEIATWLPQTVR